MPAILSLVAPLLPYLMAILGAVAGYFYIKRKGVSEERARQETAKSEAVEKFRKKVEVAVSKDQTVEAKVEAKIEEIKDASAPVAPSNPNKFRF